MVVYSFLEKYLTTMVYANVTAISHSAEITFEAGQSHPLRRCIGTANERLHPEINPHVALARLTSTNSLPPKHTENIWQNLGAAKTIDERHDLS